MLLLIALLAAQANPLPELKVEATDGGSAIVIRNNHPSQALTAYLIELVDYPGSSFALSQDELAQGGEPLEAGKQRRLPIANMTVGAAGEYVKMQAALFADGSAAGIPEKVDQLRARRKVLHSLIREILQQPDAPKSMLLAAAAIVPGSGSKLKRADPKVVDQASRRALIEEALALQESGMLQARFSARDRELSK
jgi:hypothetical protein